jgi:hypothetical protein
MLLIAVVIALCFAYGSASAQMRDITDEGPQTAPIGQQFGSPFDYSSQSGQPSSAASRNPIWIGVTLVAFIVVAAWVLGIAESVSGTSSLMSSGCTFVVLSIVAALVLAGIVAFAQFLTFRTAALIVLGLFAAGVLQMSIGGVLGATKALPMIVVTTGLFLALFALPAPPGSPEYIRKFRPVTAIMASVFNDDLKQVVGARVCLAWKLEGQSTPQEPANARCGSTNNRGEYRWRINYIPRTVAVVYATNPRYGRGIGETDKIAIGADTMVLFGISTREPMISYNCHTPQC